MKKLINLTTVAIALLALLPSCMHQISKDNLSKLSIGMTKEQVISCLGKPYVTRCALTDAESNVLEMWEYQVFQPWQGAVSYVVGFKNNKLKLYGQPKDFEQSADHVQEFRVR